MLKHAFFIYRKLIAGILCRIYLKNFYYFTKHEI